MTMRARLEPDHRKVAAWLCRFELPAYPAAGDIVAALELSDPRWPDARGFAWYSAMTAPADALQLHVCLDRPLRRRWSRGAMLDIARVPWLMGANYLVAARMTPAAERTMQAAGMIPAPGGLWFTKLPGKWGDPWAS